MGRAGAVRGATGRVLALLRGWDRLPGIVLVGASMMIGLENWTKSDAMISGGPISGDRTSGDRRNVTIGDAAAFEAVVAAAEEVQDTAMRRLIL